jgi:hypothetical protein
MTLDPETHRITIQAREFGDGDFPRGARGRNWTIRVGDIDDAQWAAALAAGPDAPNVDLLHREAWDAARKEGEPLWSELSDG